MMNAHNLYFKLLRRAWGPYLCEDGFGAFNGHEMHWSDGTVGRRVIVEKWHWACRVYLWHTFSDAAVRQIPYSKQGEMFTSWYTFLLSPDPAKHLGYSFQYGSTDAEIRANVDLLVNSYLRFGRPFFRLPEAQPITEHRKGART
jgi:hypothetical protein